jgi:DNA polymerase-4
MRKIIHIDMDCFYAAVEVRDFPELAGKPVAVGGQSARGVLTTCNYEARRFGCRSAMPTFKALRMCPDLIVRPVRFERYREASNKVREILRACTQQVEPLSLDEAYLDVTAHNRYGWTIAKEIRGAIESTTGLTASAGIAPNKMLAKIASDWRKPNGQFAVTPEMVDTFMRDLPVAKIWGVGPKGSNKLAKLGVVSCGELQQLPAHRLRELFGRFGDELFNLCRGLDDRPVEPRRLRKSLSNERTFERNLEDWEGCRDELDRLYRELVDDLDGKAAGRQVAKAFVKVKFSDFTRTTKECVCRKPDLETFRALLREAFHRSGESVRLIGAGVRFRDEDQQDEVDQLELDL